MAKNYFQALETSFSWSKYRRKCKGGLATGFSTSCPFDWSCFTVFLRPIYPTFQLAYELAVNLKTALVLDCNEKLD